MPLGSSIQTYRSPSEIGRAFLLDPSPKVVIHRLVALHAWMASGLEQSVWTLNIARWTLHAEQR
jgi:hypothetical protein